MKGHRNLWLQCVNGIWPSDNTSWLQKNSHSNITKKSYKIRSMKPAMLLPLARSNQSCHLTNIAVVLQVQTEASGPRNCSRVVVTWVEQVPAFRHWRILNQLKLPSSAAFPSFFFCSAQAVDICADSGSIRGHSIRNFVWQISIQSSSFPVTHSPINYSSTSATYC